MKTKTKSYSFSFLMFLAVSLGITACSKKAGATAVADPAAIKGEIDKTFSQSSGDVHREADECVKAAQNDDPAAAFLGFQNLSGRSDLTPQQKSSVAHAMVATFQQLRTAADKGDPKAKAVMQQYLSSR